MQRRTVSRAMPLSISLLTALAPGAIARPTWVPPYWNIARLGLTDAEHTAPDGHQSSALPPSVLPFAGAWIIGNTERFAPGAGRSAWLWSRPAGTTRIGLTDAAHTSALGRQVSDVLGVNPSGRAIGYSQRFAGSAPLGLTAWLRAPGGALNTLGFTDADHTRADGYRSSRPIAISADDIVVGVSDRYCGSSANGRSAWAWSPSTGLARLGFTDANHTFGAACGGLQESDIVGLTSTGVALGTSSRYTGATSLHLASAWAWSPTQGVRALGLTDAAHTLEIAALGSLRYSAFSAWNDAGHIAGVSWRYNGQYSGETAWVWTAATNEIVVGFEDAEHTASASVPFRSSVVTALSASGRAIGRSTRYNGAAAAGATAWTWTHSGGLLRLGYIDGEHFAAGANTRSSVANAVSPNGRFVAGASTRYTPAGADAGQTAWVWDADAALTTTIGLLDGQHLSPAGARFAQPVAVNDAGHVVGVSNRYHDSTGVPLGQSAWFFDPATGLTTPLVFSIRTDGRAFSEPLVLRHDGAVLAKHEIYNGATLLGRRGFLWSTLRGMTELESLPAGGAPAHGWSSLEPTHDMTPAGAILGVGYIPVTPDATTPTTALYLLAPPCPGDANADYIVDFADLNIVLTAYGASGAPGILPGDLNADGVVDFADLNIVLTAYGQGC